MANQIVVTLPEVTAASNTIEQAVGTYEQASKSLKAAADNLASTWDGDSHNAFVQQQERAFEWYTQMVNIVRTYVAALKDAVRDYDAADKESATEIKKR